MEFCRSCKSLMVPQNKDTGKILACRQCGNEKKFKGRKYQISEEIIRDRRDIPIIEGEKMKTTKEQRRYLTDLYGNEMYEE